MYTIGLISKSNLKTYSYSNYEEAKKKHKSWIHCFKLNNLVKYSTTIIDRDDTDSVVSVKTIFVVEGESEAYTIFLSKNAN